MRAIETKYKGYRFRSRLEARWAVFFNHLNIEYQYEPEGYALPSGWYLPDFFLPDIGGGLWVEVKGGEPTKLEHRLLGELCTFTGHSVTFRVGEPMMQIGEGHFENSDSFYVTLNMAGDFFDPMIQDRYEDDPQGLGEDGPYLFCHCPWCMKAGFEFDGRGARVCGYSEHYATEKEALDKIKHLGHWRADDKCYTGNSPLLVAAAIAARSARFEHGAQG